MRTLKKTLCLVLVLAMMVGLCAVGASAAKLDDYKDKDSIPNPEAIATLSAIGVIQGDDQGTFRPNDALNRAEGATIGAKMHATSGAGTSSFTDMGAYAWAQGAVAFCENNGIIAGYGDGRFGPGDPLSTVAFAKICLTSLGYDAQKEGLTGPQWEINTIKLVNALNLADGIGNPDWNGNCLRWVAGQLAYNTLQATMVDYSGGYNMTVTTSDGTKVEVGTGASPVLNRSYDYKNRYIPNTNTPTTGEEYDTDRDYSYAVDNTMQFCENYFPLLKMGTDTDHTFGFHKNVWYMGDTRVDHNLTAAKTIVSVNADTIMATYDTGIAGVTTKTLYNDGKADYKHTKLTVIVNGYTLAKDVTMERLGTTRALATYTGATAYLVDTSSMEDSGYGIADTLIIEQPLLAQVTKITEASATTDRTATLTVYDNAKGTSNVKFVTTDYAKGDFILVYPNYNAANQTKFVNTTDPTKGGLFAVSSLADSAAGSLSKYTNGANGVSALTIGGVSYSVGTNANLGPNGTTVAGGTYYLGNGMTAYLSNGFVLGIVTDAVAYGDYVFSIKAVTNGASALGNTSYTVGSVDQAGKATEVLGANITTDGSEGDAFYGYGAMTNTWATKAEATSGGYTFAPSALNNPFKMTSLLSTQPTLGTSDKTHNAVIADNSTVFIIRTASGFKSYTGLKNVPNYEKFNAKGDTSDTKKEITAYALIPDTYTGAHAVAVYVDATGATAENSTTSTIYLVSDTAGGQEQGSDGKTYNSFTAIIDGKITPILASTNANTNKYGIVIPAYTGTILAGTDDADTVYVDERSNEWNLVPISQNAAYVINADSGLLTVYVKGREDNGEEFVMPLAEDAIAYVYTAATLPLESGSPAEVLNGLYDEANKSDSKTDVTISLEKNTAGLIKTIYVNMAAGNTDVPFNEV